MNLPSRVLGKSLSVARAADLVHDIADDVRHAAVSGQRLHSADGVNLVRSQSNGLLRVVSIACVRGKIGQRTVLCRFTVD